MNKNINCDFCKKEFYSKSSRIKNNKNNYCSNICKGLAKRKENYCVICKQSFLKSLNRKTCSEKCSYILKVEIGMGKKGGSKKGRKAWNKGLTKDIDIRVLESSISLKNLYKNNPNKFKGKKHSPETIEKLKKNAGGVRKGAGRGKSGWYKTYWCDSTYELVWVIYHLDHNIAFTRNRQGFEYTWNGEIKKYYPDFIFNNIYCEIKGYLTDKDKAKFNANLDKPLKVFYKEDLNEMFKYVLLNYKYKNIEDLYEGRTANSEKHLSEEQNESVRL